MSNSEIQRRRDLLTQRLIEQSKRFNKDLLRQNLSLAFFVCVALPGIIIAFLFLVYLVLNNMSINGNEQITQIVTGALTFIKTNNILHVVALVIGVFVLTGIVLFHFSFHITFTPDELKLAGYILTITHKNGIVNYQNLHKEIEFRKLTFKEFDKVVGHLEKLHHVHLNDNENPELKVIIRDSDW